MKKINDLDLNSTMNHPVQLTFIKHYIQQLHDAHSFKVMEPSPRYATCWVIKLIEVNTFQKFAPDNMRIKLESSNKNNHTHTLQSPAPVLSALLGSQALAPQFPWQHNKVTSHSASHISSKSAHELPVMLALGSSLPPVLTLCSLALQVSQLLSFPFSVATELGET